MPFDLTPHVLEDEHVRLIPALLAPDDVADELVAACPAGLLAMFSARTPEPSNREAARAWLETARMRHGDGSWVTYLVRDAATDRLLGATCLLDLQPDIPRVEVGGTWYTPDAQGTSVNPACKRLLLSHAFDTLGCISVRLRTSHRNIRSQRAITALGARLDGILRADVRQVDGKLRDTYSYSIDHAEWACVRARLDRRLSGTSSDPVDIDLRRATMDDARAYTEYLLRNEAAFAAYSPPGAMPSAEAHAERIGAGNREMLLAWIGDEVVGHATLSNIVRGAFRSANLGYSVEPRLQGRGIATQLVTAICELARTELQLHRVEAGTLLDNAASQRVLLRCGFDRIGIARRYLNIANAWQDHLLHQRTFDEVPAVMA